MLKYINYSIEKNKFYVIIYSVMSQNRKDDGKMKNKDEKTKNKISGKKVLGKFMAVFMLVAMVLASCSTCIYYVVAAVTK